MRTGDSCVLSPGQVIDATPAEAQGPAWGRKEDENKSWKMGSRAVKCHLLGTAWPFANRNSSYPLPALTRTSPALSLISHSSGRDTRDTYTSLLNYRLLIFWDRTRCLELFSLAVLDKLQRRLPNLWSHRRPSLNSGGHKTKQKDMNEGEEFVGRKGS